MLGGLGWVSSDSEVWSYSVSPSSESKKHSHAWAGTNTITLIPDAADALGGYHGSHALSLAQDLPRTLQDAIQAGCPQIPEVAETLPGHPDHAAVDQELGKTHTPAAS